jgi:hypothetical protein
LALRIQTGPSLPSHAHAHFHSLSDQILCRFRLALQRKSGPRVALRSGTPDVLPGKYVASVDQRARACSNGRPQRLPPFLHVRPRALWLECGPVEKKKSPPPHPGRERGGCLHAGSEKRSRLAIPCRQTKWEDVAKGLALAPDIGSFSHGRAAQTLGAHDVIA